MQEIVSTVASVTDDGPKNIALCLSGGGLRATFFHLGVIKALRRRKLLSRVSNIFSVSGGSITAAHFIANWNSYCGDDDAFASAQRELLNFGKRDVRGRVVRRWILTCLTLLLPRPFSKYRFGPTEHLEREYRWLFRDKTFADIRSSPTLHILATNLITGELSSFSKDGYHVEEAGQDSFFECEIIPLSFAVTASSAFPPMFPPVQVTRELLGIRSKADVKRFALKRHLLTDGGVYDNLGFEKAILMKGRGELSADLILLSNAGGPLQWNDKSDFYWAIPRGIRTADILMSLVAQNTLSKSQNETGEGKLLHCSIETKVKSRSHVDIEKILPYIRTDLDKFSSVEMKCLIEHGERVAHEKLTEAYGASPQNDLVANGNPNVRPQKEIVDILSKSTTRKWRLLDWRDGATYILLGLALTVPLSFYVLVVQPRYALVNNEKAEQARVKADATIINESERLRQSLVVAEETIAGLEQHLRARPNASCRIPSNGVERYARIFTVTEESGWMGGGHTQPDWCNNLIARLRSSNPKDSDFKVVNSGEQRKNTCPPLNCPQYNYFCTVQVQAEPIYYERDSPACPR